MAVLFFFYPKKLNCGLKVTAITRAGTKFPPGTFLAKLKAAVSVVQASIAYSVPFSGPCRSFFGSEHPGRKKGKICINFWE